jgi:hypothetical protein
VGSHDTTNVNSTLGGNPTAAAGANALAFGGLGAALGGNSTAAGDTDALAFGGLGAALGGNPTAAAGAVALAFGVGAAPGGNPTAAAGANALAFGVGAAPGGTSTAAGNNEDGAVALLCGRRRLVLVEQRGLGWATGMRESPRAVARFVVKSPPCRQPELG